MSTRAELEDQLEQTEERLADARETVTWLFGLVRDEHDAHHDDAWPVCDRPVCRQVQDEAARAELAELMAS